MSDTSPTLDLPLIQASQAQKHVTHNEAIELLDITVQLVVEEFDALVPPVTPSEGETWATGAGASGAWLGQDMAIASFRNGGWLFVTPRQGWRAWGKLEGELRGFDGSGWVSIHGDFDNLAGVGINATSDTTNRLSVSSDATLFNHDGDDHRMKLNKASANDTATLLFQTGFSGRAEIGLAGADDFSFKVSSDGSAWTEAIRIDAGTGVPELPEGVEITGTISGTAIQQSDADDTAGRLMRADWGVLRTDIVGTVTEAGGIPTGAIVEKGENANGEYVRYADGTQMCALRNWLADAAGSTWTFPADFISQGTTSVLAISTNTNVARVATAISASAATATVRVFTIAGVGTSAGVTTFAFGRWF